MVKMSEIQRCPTVEELRVRREAIASQAMDSSIRQFANQINNDIVIDGKNTTTFLEFDIANFNPNALIRLAEEKGYSCVYRENPSTPMRHRITVSTPEYVYVPPIAFEDLVFDHPALATATLSHFNNNVTSVDHRDATDDQLNPLEKAEEKPKEEKAKAIQYSLLSVEEHGGYVDYDFIEFDEIEDANSKDIEVSGGLLDRVVNGIVKFFSKKT